MLISTAAASVKVYGKIPALKYAYLMHIMPGTFQLDIEWDPAKAASNLSKHGVGFSDVEAAFYDDQALSMQDSLSSGEERFILVGTDALGGS